MSPKIKKEQFNFTFQTFLRLTAFFIFLYFLISYLSVPKSRVLSDSTLAVEENNSQNTYIKDTFDNLYGYLPPKSRETLENLNNSQPVIYLQDKINYLKSQTNGFPEKQIKDIEKMVIRNIYEDMIKNIDNK